MSALTFAPSCQDTALDMASHSLRCMASGGVIDHVGGGFSRYSVDEHWHVPHFEKMLYDNGAPASSRRRCPADGSASIDDAQAPPARNPAGQLASTCLDAFLATRDPVFADVARGILDYLQRDMTAPQGGIFRCGRGRGRLAWDGRPDTPTARSRAAAPRTRTA